LLPLAVIGRPPAHATNRGCGIRDRNDPTEHERARPSTNRASALSTTRHHVQQMSAEARDAAPSLLWARVLKRATSSDGPKTVHRAGSVSETEGKGRSRAVAAELPADVLPDGLLTDAEVAEFSNVPASWVAEASRQGRLPHVMLGPGSSLPSGRRRGQDGLALDVRSGASGEPGRQIALPASCKVNETLRGWVCVPACGGRVQFVAVRHKHEGARLQGVSARRSSSRLVPTDF
jgi:hypothetical protein